MLAPFERSKNGKRPHRNQVEWQSGIRACSRKASNARASKMLALQSNDLISYKKSKMSASFFVQTFYQQGRKMKRKIEIIAIEQTRIVGGNGQTYCSFCKEFAEFLTTVQAARVARIKTESIRRWVSSGKAHGIKTIGGQHRVCCNSLFPGFQQKKMSAP